MRDKLKFFANEPVRAPRTCLSSTEPAAAARSIRSCSLASRFTLDAIPRSQSPRRLSGHRLTLNRRFTGCANFLSFCRIRHSPTRTRANADNEYAFPVLFSLYLVISEFRRTRIFESSRRSQERKTRQIRPFRRPSERFCALSTTHRRTDPITFASALSCHLLFYAFSFILLIDFSLYFFAYRFIECFLASIYRTRVFVFATILARTFTFRFRSRFNERREFVVKSERGIAITRSPGFVHTANVFLNVEELQRHG